MCAREESSSTAKGYWTPRTLQWCVGEPVFISIRSVPSVGIEPTLQDPQSCVLSIERQGLISVF